MNRIVICNDRLTPLSPKPELPKLRWCAVSIHSKITQTHIHCSHTIIHRHLHPHNFDTANNQLLINPFHSTICRAESAGLALIELLMVQIEFKHQSESVFRAVYIKFLLRAGFLKEKIYLIIYFILFYNYVTCDFSI